MRYCILFCTLLVLLMSGVAVAAEDKAVEGLTYLEGSLGMSWNDDSYTGEEDTAIEYDSGSYYTLAIGRKMNLFRFDIEYLYTASDFSTIDNSMELSAFTTNVYLDFGITKSVSSYITIGGGAGGLDFNRGNTANVFVGKYGTGFILRINDDISMDAGYRSIITNDTIISGQELSFKSDIVSIGVMYVF